MVSQETLKLYLFPLRVCSFFWAFPYDWTSKSQTVQLSNNVARRLVAICILILNIFIRIIVILVITFNLISLSSILSITDKIIGIFCTLIFITTVVILICLSTKCSLFICFLNSSLKFHQYNAKIWKQSPKQKDGLETLFKFILVTGTIILLLSVPAILYLIITQQDKALRFISRENMLENIILTIICTIGFGMDLCLIGTWFFNTYMHYYYNVGWINKLSWNRHVNRIDKIRIRVSYRGIQLLHKYLMEAGREIYPFMALIATTFLNCCLFCALKYYSSLSISVTMDLLILSCFIILLFKMTCHIINSLTEASKNLGDSYCRNQASYMSKMDKRLFRSYQPCQTTIQYLFTFSNNTFPHLLRNAIIDTVITLLLAFE